VRVEPEGILGTLTSVVLCMLGVQAGKTVLLYKDHSRDILLRLVAWGIALVRIGWPIGRGREGAGWEGGWRKTLS